MIVVPADDQGNPNPMPLLRYDSELGTLVDSTGDIESPTNSRIVLNRRGTLMLIRNANSGLIQLMTTAPPNTVMGTLVAGTADAAFSPTADIIYGYDDTGTLTAYDLATGTPLAPGLAIAGTGSTGLVTVSPDGGTVFVAGDQELAVVPAADVPQ
jgi:DNA-binding beta-propeller fold protein YncE